MPTLARFLLVLIALVGPVSQSLAVAPFEQVVPDSAQTEQNHNLSPLDTVISVSEENLQRLRRIKGSATTSESDKGTTSEGGVSLSFGGSFDFVTGLKMSDIYGDVTGFYPRPFSRDCPLGIAAGIVQSLTMTRDTTSLKLPRWVNGTLQVEDTAAISPSLESVSSNDLLLYAGLTFQFNESLFGVFHADVRKKDISYRVAYHVQDSSESVRDTVANRRITGYDASYGLGGIFHHTEGGYLITIEPILGFGLFNGYGGFSYIVRFTLAEKIHDIRFGGEIRGRNTDAPDISIHIAKGFALSDLAKLF